MNTISRKITPTLLNALKVSPVIFLNGARQVGKSTLVQSLRNEIGSDNTPADYVSFDRPTQMAAAATSPEAFLTGYKNTLIIDEVQMVPELFRTLKTVVDDLRLKDRSQANGKYLVTGSANILALPQLSNALVGRMSILTLYPFCTAEVSQGKGDLIYRIVNMDFSHMNDRKI